MKSLIGMIMIACGAGSFSLGAVSSTGTVNITASSRFLETQTFGYDWDFNNGEVDTASTNLLGSFVDSVFVDLDEWYGGHVGTGNGTVDSVVSGSAIDAFFELYASCIDAGVYSADCSTVGRLDVDFTVATRVRTKISFEIFSYDDWAWGYSYLTKVGGGTILSLDVFGVDDGGASKTTWLQAGNYEVYGEGNTGAGGTYGTSDDSTLSHYTNVQFFHEADYDTDGHVNLADRTAFLAAYNAGSLAADFNGSGTITKADRSAFLSSWNANHE